MTFEQIKAALEPMLVAKLSDTNGNFKIVTDIEWWGTCPRPSPKVKAQNMHVHLVEDSRVCLDCEQIHIVERDVPKFTYQTLQDLVNFVDYHYRRMIHT